MTDYYDMAIRHPRKVAALIAELQAENNDLNHEINVKAEWNMKYYERIDELSSFITKWLSTDSFTPDQYEFKLIRECQARVEDK